MPAITITDLNNAKLDVDHIADMATSTAPTATDRLGGVKKTMAGVSIELAQQVTQVSTAKDTAINTTIPSLVSAVQVAKDTAITVSIPAAVALVDTAVAATAAGQATAAKLAAEAARDSLNTTGKVFTSEEGTAAGISATTNLQQFSVLSSDLLSYGIWRNNAGVAKFLSSIYTSNYLNSLIKNTKYRGWAHVIRSSSGKLGVGITDAGKVIFGIGGDIVARILSAEVSVSSLKSVVTSVNRYSSIFLLLDSTKTKVALEVNRAGKLISMGRDVLSEIDTTKSQVNGILSNPALLSKFISPSKDLTLLGDSQINGAGPTPWRTLLAPLISARNYRNLAVGGQTSTQIAARYGSIYSLITVSNNIIPTSGSVGVSSCKVIKTDGTFDNSFTPLTDQSSQTINGTLAGVDGSLVRATDGSLTFLRSVSGVAVNCGTNTPFKPTWNDYDLNTIITGIGRNNLWDVATIKRDTIACFNSQRSVEKRQIILTPTNGGSIIPSVPTNEGIGTVAGDAVVAIEDWAESYFTGTGVIVVNMRKLLMPLNNGTPDDLADVAAGTVPRSLRIDSVHYSAAAHAIIANYIASIINSKGW